MDGIRYVTEGDRAFWFTLDRHISEDELGLKIRDKRGYVLSDGGRPVGVLRYNLFWDNTPFLTLLAIAAPHRGKGLGSKAVLSWENEMRLLGYPLVMTSTMVNEQAQHFYRKLGYVDRGSLFLDGTPLEQPQELIMLKVLSPEPDLDGERAGFGRSAGHSAG